jgi:hypothetical protein
VGTCTFNAAGILGPGSSLWPHAIQVAQSVVVLIGWFPQGRISQRAGDGVRGARLTHAPSRTSSQTPSDASPLHVSSQNIGGGGSNGGGINGGAGGVLGTGGEKPAVGAGGSGGGGEPGEAGDSGSGGGTTGGGSDGEGEHGGVLGEGGSDGGGGGGCGGGGLGGGGSGLGMGTQVMPFRLQYSASHALRVSVSSVSSGPLRSSRTVTPKV